MERIYLDNASTSFPKPPQVVQAVCEYMTGVGANIGRGGYESAYCAEEMVYETRQLLCDLFHGDDCRNVVFTKNVTESLNVLLKGFLKAGDHVLVSSMEHNAVMRPLAQLERLGVRHTCVPCSAAGELDVQALASCMTPQTKAIVMTHASNVCGTVLPLAKIGRFCRENGLRFIVDSAQTAGVLDLDMQRMNIDALAFTGHKGLLGPQGIGGFVIRGDMAAEIEPLLCGGTGSASHMHEMPGFMPDRFEPGTMNLPGIAGLRAGLLFLREKGIDDIRNHELELTRRFLDGLEPLERRGLLSIVGRRDAACRVGVVSVQTHTVELAQAAFELDDRFRVMTRVGLHCAPDAHRTLGTYPRGTIRFSFGLYNTQIQADAAADALRQILNGK